MKIPPAFILVMVLLALALLLSGCASTVISEMGRDGKSHPVLKIQANASNVTFKTAQSDFHADTLNHSTPTVAGGAAATRVVTAVSGMAGTVSAALITNGVVR